MMSWLNAFTVDQFLVFTLVFARVGGLVATAPLFGMTEVPMRVRAFLAVALALLVTSLQCGVAIAQPDGLLDYAILLGSEIVIGACLGLGVMILVYAMGLAGELVGYAGGLTVSDILDSSTGENVPHLSRLMVLVSLCVFLCIGGHRMVMAGLLDTFQAIPPGSCATPHALLDAFTTLVAQSFSLGIRAAAPAVTALLLATIALGLIGRTLPQLNVLSMGFGLNALLTFAVLGLTLGAATWAFQDEIEPALRTILDALHTPVRPEWLS
jgi:flagellar biosynthesis protein FliR